VALWSGVYGVLPFEPALYSKLVATNLELHQLAGNLQTIRNVFIAAAGLRASHRHLKLAE